MLNANISMLHHQNIDQKNRVRFLQQIKNQSIDKDLNDSSAAALVQWVVSDFLPGSHDSITHLLTCVSFHHHSASI